MIGLLDPVTLKRDRPDLGVVAGQLGTVVHVHGDKAFEVEFADAEGRTITLAALTADELSLGGHLPPAALSFLVFQDRSGAYRWRLKARDGSILATGEPYADKGECLRAIRLLAGEIRQAEVLDQTAA